MTKTTQHTQTQPTPGSWFFCLDDLTIRTKSQDSNCMGDYRGNIIADLKPSLGLTQEDIEAGSLSADSTFSYINGNGARQHAWDEVMANAMEIVGEKNRQLPEQGVEIRREGSKELVVPTAEYNQVLSQVTETLIDTLEELSKVEYKNYRQDAEHIGVAKYMIDKLIATVESYQ